MNWQFSLVKLSCIFVIASSAYAEPLQEDVRQQYVGCFEIVRLITDSPMTVPLGSFVIDNLCIDSNGLYRFLSSAQGGTTSYVAAPKSQMTCVFWDSKSIGIKLNSHPRLDANLLVQFAKSAHAVHVYNDIYRTRDLARMNFTIDRVEVLLVSQIGNRIMYRSKLTQRAGLYTELYQSDRNVFTLKGESADGDVGNPVMVFLAQGFNISDVLANNNVVLRSHRNFPCFYIFTFGDESEANHFCESLRGYVDQRIPVSVPATLQQVLETTRV